MLAAGFMHLPPPYFSRIELVLLHPAVHLRPALLLLPFSPAGYEISA
jgi:hypothetical protein